MNVQLFKPYQKQKDIIDGFADTDYLFGVVVAPRGSGKTLLASNLLLYWALSNNNSKCGWISPIYNQAKSVFETIVKAAYDTISAHNKSELTITLINGSTIKFLSADAPNSVRGFRFEYLVLDEVAYQTENAITEAIMPTLNPNGKKCLMISTPRSKNHFYEWFMKGLEGDNVISYKIPLSECPYVKPELIEEARKSLPHEIFKQEYEAEFGDSTNDVFQGVSDVCILKHYDGPQRNERYFAGLDVGIQHDYSVLTIISESGRVGNIIRLTGTTFAEVRDLVIHECARWSIHGGYVETNGIGLALFEMLKPKVRKLQGFTTTNDSKTTGIRKLIYDIQQGNLELPSKELFPPLYNELSSYTYKINSNGNMTFSAPNGLFDDCVMSLMLANQARLSQFNPSKMYIGGGTTKQGKLVGTPTRI